MLRLCGLTTLALLVSLLSVHGFPDSRNPNTEYELINPRAPQINNKPLFIATTTTPRSVLVITPPPPPEDSKNFLFDSATGTWTMLKKNGPPPPKDALIWNQNNDKWLTMSARV